MIWVLVENDPDKNKLLFGLNVKTFIEKICFENADEFVMENL
jgi:hypothetical protein